MKDVRDVIDSSTLMQWSSANPTRLVLSEFLAQPTRSLYRQGNRVSQPVSNFQYHIPVLSLTATSTHDKIDNAFIIQKYTVAGS